MKNYTPRLKEKYSKEIVPSLKEKFNYNSIMEVPKVEKIVISQGVGEAVSDRKLIENAAADLSSIAGQKALRVNSKNSSISSRLIGRDSLVIPFEFFFTSIVNSLFTISRA